MPDPVPGAAVSPGINSCNFANAPALTMIPALVPVIEPVTVSVAVKLRDPAVFSVYAFVNVWTPLSPPTNV